MISRFVTRVLPHTFAPNVAALSGLRVALGARQHLVARTFLTTAHVSEPAAKAGANKSKSTKSKTTPKKTAAAKKGAAAKKKPAKKAKVSKPKKDDSNDPEARFKHGLKAVKVKKSEYPPIKPVTPYNLFMREHYKDSGLTGPISERSAAVAAIWKQLGDAEKQPYVERAESLKEDFVKAQREWFENTDPRILRALNTKRKAQNKPLIHPPAHLRIKRPLSSYMLYMLEVRDSIELDSSLPVRDAMLKRASQVGKMWQDLPADEKQRYADQYKKAFGEYKATQSANA